MAAGLPTGILDALSLPPGMAALLAVVRRVEREEIADAVARGWYHDANRHEAMDADLAAAIAEEALAVLRPIDAAKRAFPTPRKV